MCQHKPKCTTQQQHISKLYNDMHAAPTYAEDFGEPLKADYWFVIRWEQNQLKNATAQT